MAQLSAHPSSTVAVHISPHPESTVVMSLSAHPSAAVVAPLCRSTCIRSSCPPALRLPSTISPEPACSARSSRRCSRISPTSSCAFWQRVCVRTSTRKRPADCSPRRRRPRGWASTSRRSPAQHAKAACQERAGSVAAGASRPRSSTSSPSHAHRRSRRLLRASAAERTASALPSTRSAPAAAGTDEHAPSQPRSPTRVLGAGRARM